MRRLAGRVAGIGIAVLVIVDAVLLVVALRPRHAPPASLTAGVPLAAPSASAGGSPAPQPTTGGAPARTPADLLVDTAVGGVGIRATTSLSCTGAPDTAAVTADGGASWRAVNLPVAHVLRVHAVGTGDVWLVGTAAGCTPALYQSTNGGATWSAGSAAGAWYLLPGGVGQLHVPGRDVTPSCPTASIPAQLDPISGAAAYLVCAGPTGPAALLVTEDTGANWQRLPAAPVTGEVAQSWGSLDAGYLV
ncbi:MAG: beta propeller repeat protein, partial [Mycobacteriales bacterium]